MGCPRSILTPLKGDVLIERSLIGEDQVIYVDADTGLRTGRADPRPGGAAVGQNNDPE